MPRRRGAGRTATRSGLTNNPTVASTPDATMRQQQAAVHAWARDHLRDLPWRQTRDPWSILVAEVMLQQTQVARVEPAWRRFLDRFPNVGDAAASGRGEVVTLWAGLGYNNRAVRLHRAAQQVVERFDGVFPSEVAHLISLPGIGPYTARAIRAFAFELPGAVVDTNVARILARLAGVRLTPAAAQRAADALADEADPWTWNQSMIDLGATVCTPRNPACDRCPLAPGCSWRGGPDGDPAAVPPSKRQARFEGSDRQARGRLLDACRSGPVLDADVSDVIRSLDPERVERVVSGLVRDGLIQRRGGLLRLAD